ncbi:grpE protein homolog 2, mitochondrial isoform X2 [Juglans microcarpa x Juglans regia]|uniref:grpE protein homolog 2, mitochondrial isoform X2 n=1 Tax=Juglans microcarpa x Juglans regia TaxID=2249226 RepID=UPI001B7EC98E|nr:grpE protein homolog 2, mitochondrial isoform X2 [Juglans microcarpa x Juglans regia]
MFVSRVFSRVPRRIVPRSSLLLLSVPQNQQSAILCDHLHSLARESPNALVPSQVSFLHHSAPHLSIFQRFGVSSSASPEPTDKENGSNGENNGASRNAEPSNTSGDAKLSNQAEDSDSESGEELSMDDLVKLVAEKEELLKLKHEEIEKMQDKVLRSYAEMENVMDRTRREAGNSKKFAIQSFAKSLLDVADNLERASLEVKKSFAKLDTSTDSAGALPLLKTLLEGVEMTEKQLLEVFKKYGVERFDPLDEPFDPHRHNAVFQLPDGSKPPGTVAAVLKSGYLLHDRVIRPAEVGVTPAVENAAEDSAS